MFQPSMSACHALALDWRRLVDSYPSWLFLLAVFYWLADLKDFKKVNEIYDKSRSTYQVALPCSRHDETKLLEPHLFDFEFGHCFLLLLQSISVLRFQVSEIEYRAHFVLQSPRSEIKFIIIWKMEGIIVRRVIPSDNSCLFNAVGYVMDHDRTKAPELRQVIAATVASDPTKYSEAFLGKPNAEYCSWILDSEKWGGAIELSILADYYGREIAAYDIQTTRCDLYGQEKNYSERVMLIYDGLHYDALAMSPFEGAPEEFDQTIFAVQKDRTIGPVEGLALNLVKDQQRKRSYTDTANFTLRCGVCQIGVVGQKEAVEHAQATGHVNFQEYR
ncbi:hypothetical protein V6N13_049619 [Hibiscus sabdariffa]